MDNLILRLERLGYVFVRQRGSHMTLSTSRGGKHNLRIPDHNPVAPGTLRSILRSAAQHAMISEEQILRLLEL